MHNSDAGASSPRTATLDTLKAGEGGHVVEIVGDETFRLRLMEMGMLRGETVRVVRFAPLGDPMEITLGSYHLSLRKLDARNIVIAPL